MGVSREWIRRLADAAGVKSHCRKCGAVIGAREKWCATHREEKRLADSKKYQKRKLKTFSNRPVVLEAYQFFSELGLDVVLNVESKRHEPEIFVNGHGVKCNAMVPVSRGHQCRLQPNEMAEWIYLSDGEMNMGYLIPAVEIVQKQTYIGEKSGWHRYEMDAWGPDGIREVLA